MNKNTKNNNLPSKTNLSSTQVLKTLHVLLEDNYSMAELIEKLNENEPEPVFNNSVVSKYINTCRNCGISILKISNRYYVSGLPFGLDISDSEYDLIKYLLTRASDLFNSKTNQDLNKIFQIISKYSNREIEYVEKSSISIVLTMFEQVVRDGRKVLLMLKDKTKMECVPRDVFDNNGKLYFHVYCNNKEKNIALSRVVAVEALKERVSRVKEDGAIIYELTGNLAKNYTLRENERILTNGLPKCQSVVNYNENTPLLLSRLLKYGELCEVKSPKHIREEFRNMIDETLANYGE